MVMNGEIHLTFFFYTKTLQFNFNYCQSINTFPLAEPSRDCEPPFLPPPPPAAFDALLSVDLGLEGLFFLSLSPPVAAVVGDLFPFDGDVLPPLGDFGFGGALTFLALSAISLSCSIFHAFNEL